MGREQTFKGYKGLVYAAVFITLFILNGCGGKILKNKDAVSEKKKEFSLEAIEHLIRNNDFKDALLENNRNTGKLKVEAIFQKGIIYLHPESPYYDITKGLDCFEIIIKDKIAVNSELYNRAVVFRSVILKYLASQKKLNALAITVISNQKQIDKLKNETDKLKNETDKLKNETDKLKNQLEHLKEIDLNIEENKRKSVLQ